MLRCARRGWAVTTVAVVIGVTACSGDDSGSTSSPAPTTATATTPAPTTSIAAPSTTEVPDGPLTTRPGVNQIAVLDAPPGAGIEIVNASGDIVAKGVVDEQGSYLARQLVPGDYRVATTGEPLLASGLVTVHPPDEVPAPTLYTEQVLATGFGYIATRDGTTLSANVVLPGPVEDGPYPTVVEYSGYSPSNPDGNAFATLFTSLGYAYVGVNMRGTGCSGGSWRFFEAAQNVDGYDVIETVAAQPWVANHRVGMVGVSFPGISQLFVAATQPPSLAAITPLSVLDDSYRSTLYPGGILNTGFAVSWLTERVEESRPFGQAWTKGRADAGDETCAANQKLRLQNPDMLAEVRANPFYEDALGDAVAPATFVDRINVPVFVAGAWQDEQTGGHFPAMLDDFTGSPHVYATLMNGLHTESIGPSAFPRLVEFLDLYVARRVPSLDAARLIAPVLAAGIYGTDQVSLPPDRFEGMTYDAALAAFEADPPIQIVFEEGAADGSQPGAPMGRFTRSFAAWPVPEAVPTTWRLHGGEHGNGVAGDCAPPADCPAAATYTADPAALPATFYTGTGNDIWRYDTTYDWHAIPDGKGLTYTSAPLAADTVIAGSGSADLWISSSAADTDLEVTISEVRTDGTVVYVQSGWLRASERALDTTATTATRPAPTQTEADAAPLPTDGSVVPVRVEIFPFAHAFRAGSSLRVTIDAPGNARPVWAFESISAGEQVTVHSTAEFPSAVVLDVIPGVEVPPGYPACGSLRGQPCRAAP
jgi:predicted acyl esterase